MNCKGFSSAGRSPSVFRARSGHAACSLAERRASLGLVFEQIADGVKAIHRERQSVLG